MGGRSERNRDTKEKRRNPQGAIRAGNAANYLDILRLNHAIGSFIASLRSERGRTNLQGSSERRSSTWCETPSSKTLVGGSLTKKLPG